MSTSVCDMQRFGLLVDKFNSFARRIKHRHNFVDGRCEFCSISEKECDHNKKNIKTKSFHEGTIITKCECGYTKTEKCFHEFKNFRHNNRSDDSDDDYYEYCEKCCSILNVH